jgi:hypothetical protein
MQLVSIQGFTSYRRLSENRTAGIEEALGGFSKEKPIVVKVLFRIFPEYSEKDISKCHLRF